MSTTKFSVKRASPWFFFNLSTLQTINNLYVFYLYKKGISIITKLRSRPLVTKRNIRLQQYKTDLANNDYELSRRVWRSIETLLMSQDYGKNWEASMVDDLFISIQLIRIFSFLAPGRAGKTRKIGYYANIRYDSERILNPNPNKEQ